MWGADRIAPWFAHEDVIAQRLVPARSRAGECLVLDNQLVHRSLPNHTAARYCVDIDFYTRSSVFALVERAPEVRADEIIDIGAADISADELAAELHRLAAQASAPTGA